MDGRRDDRRGREGSRCRGRGRARAGHARRGGSRSGCASTGPLLAHKRDRTLHVGQTRSGDTEGAGNARLDLPLPDRRDLVGPAEPLQRPRAAVPLPPGPRQRERGRHRQRAPAWSGVPDPAAPARRELGRRPVGLPLNVGPLPSEFSIVPAAGLDFPPAGDYYVSVESPPHAAGRYTIRLWANDHTPPRDPRARPGRARRPPRCCALRITDAGSGVNPGGVLVTATASRTARCASTRAPVSRRSTSRGCRRATHRIRVRAPDLAETKDVLSSEARPSNTATRVIRVTIPG